MAKVKFKEYLRRRKNSGPIYESDEGLMKRAVQRIESDPLIVQGAFRVENFEKAAELLEQAGDYPGASELREECLNNAAKAREEKKESDYQHAVMHMDEAVDEEDLIKVRTEFKKLKDYKDSGERREEVSRKISRMRRIFRLKQCAVLLVIVIFALGGYMAVQAGYLSYAIASLEGMGRMYDSAYSRFSDLGKLLDSEKKAEHYKLLIDKQRESTEGKSLKKAHKGDKVSFGEHKWIVLERKESRRLLLCQTVKEGIFSELPYNDNAGDVIWKDSSLRAYLNGEALDEFTDYEKEALVSMETDPGSNSKYGTDGGEPVEDLVRILSLAEARKYQKIFEKPNADMWLCTPGHEMDTAAYMTKSGIIMSYGTGATDDLLSACPVICVDVSKLSPDA